MAAATQILPGAAPPDQSATAAAGTSFDPYARLFRVLIPSLRSVVMHDGFGNKVWASDEWEVLEQHGVINDVIANALSDRAPYAGIMRTLDADRVVYAFAIRGEGSEICGIVSLIAQLNAAQTAVRELGYVAQLVQPALECLHREFTILERLGSREEALGGRERDLSLMLEMSSQRPLAASDADEFDLILKTGLDHMKCVLAALWVPEKNIHLSLTRSGQRAPETLQRAQQHLMAWMLIQQRTIVVNRVSKAPAKGAAPFKILACPVRHPSERVMGVLALFNPASAQDFDAHQTRIAELLARKATIIIQAQYDASTGLMTRQAFERQATAIVSAPSATLPHCILYLDIDRLHVINETFGMHVGDDVIVSVAECLAQTLPPAALSARISGDRLAALIPLAGVEAAAAVAESIRAAVAGLAARAGRGAFEVSASLGVAPVGKSATALAHALATAEIACKAAKDRGRNRVEVFQDSDHSIIRRHTDVMVAGRLREALDLDRFRLDAQPILPLRANQGRPRFELLIRMIGERGEIIAPGKFLSAADRYQLMPAIDRWVVRHACRTLARHAATVHHESARFAINLSGQSLQDESFLDFVLATIAAEKMEPAALCFELTETATVGNLTKAQNFMRTLQDIGCQFALDDFGTGVSSLSYLKDLSVDYLKIDGSFVRDALVNSRSESMIKAISQLAKAMRMETIAEYVETDDLRVRMGDLGVDYGQGFAMGRTRQLESLLAELAEYEATVSNLALESPDGDPQSSRLETAGPHHV